MENRNRDLLNLPSGSKYSPNDIRAAESKSNEVPQPIEHSENYVAHKTPKCTRCRNHGKIIPIKSHKRYCPYNSCTCAKCQLVIDRKRVLAMEVALRRTAQDEEIFQSKNDCNPREESFTQYGLLSLGEMGSGRYAVQRLIEIYGLSTDITSLSSFVYACLKNCEFDIAELSKKVQAARTEIRYLTGRELMERPPDGISVPQSSVTSFKPLTTQQDSSYPRGTSLECSASEMSRECQQSFAIRHHSFS